MKLFFKLLRFAVPYRRTALLAFMTLLCLVALDLSVPRLVGRIIDDGIRPGDMGVVLGTSILMLCISALSAVVAVLNSNASIRVGEGVARDLRQAIFERIQEFSFGNFDRFSTGRLLVRLSSDTAAVQRLFLVSLRIGTRAPLSMLGSIVLMFVTSPTLALAMLPVWTASIFVIVLFSARMEPGFQWVQQKLDRLNTILQENIAGARLVKAFVRADSETERFDEANADLAAGTVRVMRFMASMSPLLTFLVNTGIVLVVWVGGRQVVEGKLTLGQIVTFANYLLATLHPLVLMAQLSNTWVNGLASAARIVEILETEPEIREAPDAVDLPPGAACDIGFEDVGFSYDGDSAQDVLSGVTLCAKSGETTAVLGAIGSGKSSLVNLVPRFYDVSAGVVRVAGIDVRNIRQNALLARTGIVPQETVLFSGTVRDAIRFGRFEVPDEEIVAAAKAARAHDFILRLPDGYDTLVGERGATLSGGQRQRIAIARAIVGKPEILILDDSTSSVDVETETEIQDALREYMRGSTCIVVAQRISTVLNADRIAVLDEGRIAAVGTHAELIESCSIYREIYDSQLGGAPMRESYRILPAEGFAHGL